MPFGFLRLFSSLPYGTRGKWAGISQKQCYEHRSTHNSKIRLTAGPHKACAPPCQHGDEATVVHPGSPVPSNAGLGLTRPGSPGDSASTLAPLLCSQAEAQGGGALVGQSWGWPEVSSLLAQPIGLKPPVTDDKSLPSRLDHQQIQERTYKYGHLDGSVFIS